jgi:two-component system, OmpR family, response regulator ArlR
MYNDIIMDVHFKNEFKLNKIIGDEKMPKILVVEDDEKIIRILKIQLEHQQFDITIENDGIEAMNNVDKNRDVYDLIILDLGLPGMSGNRLCKNIRKISETPIIVLSARNSVEEKVELLQNGASDYITKPFDMNELSARIQVNIRKQKRENLTYKDIDINVANYTAKISNEQISLSKTEFELLKILVEHSEEIVTRDQIIEKLWGWDASDNLLDSTMKKLRQKIPENYIKTMRGIGYILKYEDKN